MTDEVLDINLRGPRPNFLQLLAHPDMAIVGSGGGTGPYRMRGTEPECRPAAAADRRGRGGDPAASPDILLRGEPAVRAVARFADGETRAGHRRNRGRPAASRAPPICRTTSWLRSGQRPVRPVLHPRRRPADQRRRAPGLVHGDRPAGDRRRARRARSRRRAPALSPRACRSCRTPRSPDWANHEPGDAPRRGAAADRRAGCRAPLRLRVAMPDGPGYRLVFAHLRRDWRLIGIDAERVAAGPARGPASSSTRSRRPISRSWYLRHFTCEASGVCDAGGGCGAAGGARGAPRPPSARRSSRWPTGYLAAPRRLFR